MSCCAPLLLPALLSLVEVSGTSLLSFNLRLHQFRLPLFGSALLLMTFSLSVAVRNVTRACRLRAQVGGGNERSHHEASAV